METYINKVEEVAKFLRKSPSWVYKNWRRLGGRKLGGSLMFPSKEDLYERILFKKQKRVEIRLHQKRNQVHGNLVGDERRGKGSRVQEKGGTKKAEAGDNDPNRHRLLGSG
jgi:hypothetical protein